MSMTLKLIWARRDRLNLGTLCVLACLVFVGCVSGSYRNQDVKTELSGDLPQELRDRFEVSEVAVKQDQKPEPNRKAEGTLNHPMNHPMIQGQTSNVAEKGDSQKLRGAARKSGKMAKKQQPQSDPVALPEKEVFQYPVRRPVIEPIWVGEQLEFSISYFGVSAGRFTFEVLPFKEIGQRKVYHIRGYAATSSVFSLFYRLNDRVETFVDYDGFFSHRFHILLDESKQERDSLELYDSEKKQTFYWSKLKHKERGYQEVKEYFPIPAFSQDTVSALFYLRSLKIQPGDVVTFPVVSEGKYFEAVCTVVRREELRTPMGRVPTLVIQLETKYEGILKKKGDSFLWLTDDERKLPVHLEAKVKIGTVVATLREVKLGKDPKVQDPLISDSPVDGSPLNTSEKQE